MSINDKNVDDELTPRERKLFKEKFCEGNFKARILTEAEVEALKKEGRI